MRKYIIYEHSSEFRTKKGLAWTSEQLMLAHANRTSDDPIEIARFNYEQPAREYFATLEGSWYEQQAHVGWVLLGHYFSLVEVEVDEDGITTDFIGEDITIGEYQPKEK